MTPEFLATWKRTAKAIGSAVAEDGSFVVGWEARFDRLWDRMGKRHAKSPSDDPDALLPIRWSLRLEEDMVQGFWLDFRRLLRMAYAALTGGYGDVPRTDLRYMAAKGFVPSSALPDLAPPPSGNGFRVAYVYAYGISRGLQFRMGLGTQDAWVDRVDPAMAPVVLSLPTYDGDEFGELDVRDFGGSLYRPILTPDSWAPVDEAEFAHACSGTEPWVDSPLNPSGRYDWEQPNDRWGSTGIHPARRSPPLAPREVGRFEPFGKPHDDGSGSRRVAALGRLVSVGGIVHVPVPEPEVRFRVSRDPEGPHDYVHADWACGSLTSETSQKVFGTSDGPFVLEDCVLPWMPARPTALTRAIGAALVASTRAAGFYDAPRASDPGFEAVLPALAALLGDPDLVAEERDMLGSMRAIAEAGLAGRELEAERDAMDMLRPLMARGPSESLESDVLTGLLMVLVDAVAGGYAPPDEDVAALAALG